MGLNWNGDGVTEGSLERRPPRDRAGERRGMFKENRRA